MHHHTKHVKKPLSLRQPPPEFRKTAIAIGMSTLMLGTVASAADEVINLDKLSIEDRAIETNPYAEPGAPYKARISGDERHQKPIAETPSNIQVITKSQIEDSGISDLKDILDVQPGITLGTGENGNAFGDRYIIRGQEARSDVFVDGLRDPGMSIRESFATEQVEISKGPNSSFAGRGTTGGAINSITKQASTEYDFSKLSTGIGTDTFHRLTVDTNRVLSETAAIRLNALHAYQEVPNRGPADKDRKGLALSTLLKPSEKLDVLFDYYGLRSKDTPDLGSYYNGKPVTLGGSIVRNPAVYAQSQDFLTSDIDTFTGRLKYRIDDTTRVTNITRYGMAANDYVSTGARYSATAAAGYTTSTHAGWQDVSYLANQTNLFMDRELWGKKHQINVGLELTDHKVRNGLYSIGNTLVWPGTTVGRSNISRGRWDQDWAVSAAALSVFDTVDIDERWSVTGGLRYDYYRMSLDTYTRSGSSPNYTYANNSYGYTGGLLNYHLGTSYKLRQDANVYFNHATSADINGGESDVGTDAAYGGLVARGAASKAKPERTRSFEIGTKWNVNEGKLLATLALFHITKSDVLESSSTGTGYGADGSFNSGKNQVMGIEFGLAGNLTDKLSAQGGLALMDAEVLATGQSASAGTTPVGKTLSNFARSSAALQLKYQQTPDLAIGGAVRYEGRRFAGSPDTAPTLTYRNASGTTTSCGGYCYEVPAYTVVDLFATYKINKKANLRFNVGNLFDTTHYTAGYRSGTFMYLGAARNARVTLNYDF